MKLFLILPIPPLQFFRIVLSGFDIIDCAAERVEHTAIDMLSAQFAQLFIQPLWTLALEAALTIHADSAQVFCNTFPYTRNVFQTTL